MVLANVPNGRIRTVCSSASLDVHSGISGCRASKVTAPGQLLGRFSQQRRPERRVQHAALRIAHDQGCQAARWVACSAKGKSRGQGHRPRPSRGKDKSRKELQVESQLEYIKLGRMMGVSAQDIAKELRETDMDFSEDSEATRYLKRWLAEEQPDEDGYSSFQALLAGADDEDLSDDEDDDYDEELSAEEKALEQMYFSDLSDEPSDQGRKSNEDVSVYLNGPSLSDKANVVDDGSIQPDDFDFDNFTLDQGVKEALRREPLEGGFRTSGPQVINTTEADDFDFDNYSLEQGVEEAMRRQPLPGGLSPSLPRQDSGKAASRATPLPAQPEAAPELRQRPGRNAQESRDGNSGTK